MLSKHLQITASASRGKKVGWITLELQFTREISETEFKENLRVNSIVLNCEIKASTIEKYYDFAEVKCEAICNKKKFDSNDDAKERGSWSIKEKNEYVKFNSQ